LWGKLIISAVKTTRALCIFAVAMEIVKKEFVGEGGTHCVYRCEVIGGNYQIPLVLKIFKKPNSNKVNEELQSYEAVKRLNLPTLALLEKFEFEERPAFIGEYLNGGDWLFVSTNHVITDKQRELDKINPGYLRKLFKVVAEQELYDNKLEDIQNLKEVITAALADLKIASKAKYQINFDSYFLGVIKNQKNSPLRYIVGDFGDINYCPEWTIAKLYENNVLQIKESLLEFVMHFVIEENQQYYEDQINALCMINAI
jgi:hypothetical protein